MRRFLILAAGLLLLPLVGCSREQSPDEAMQAVATGFAENKPQVYWESLPPSYQKDVDGLVKEFAGKMDPEIWNGGFGVAKKAVRVLKEKKEYILENPFIAMSGLKKEELDERWDDVVKALSILVNSDISEIDKLKNLNMQEFLSTTGADFLENATSIFDVVSQPEIKQSINDLKAAKFTLVKMDGDVATVKMTTPNKTSGEIEEAELVKVEGKWILKEVADGWAENMKKAREGLANINPDDLKENKEVIMAQIKMVDSQLNLLLDAKTADEFNDKLTAIAKIMGAGGGPPAGFDGGGFGSFEGEDMPAEEAATEDAPSEDAPSEDPLFGDKPGVEASETESPESETPETDAPEAEASATEADEAATPAAAE